MSESLFIRLLAADDKAAALAAAVDEIRAGRAREGVVFQVNPSDFSTIPGSPFAYWASERIRRLFTELPPFEGEGRTARVGLQTSDDTRFVRAWWEVAPERVVTGTAETTPEEFRQQTFAGKRWVPFAKGGEYSPYYADLHLVVNWERDGEELRGFSGSVIRNPDFYFRPGLTWPLRTQAGLSVRCLPSGAVFGHKGPSAFVPKSDLFSFLGVTNSVVFRYLVHLQMAFGSYEVGVLQRTPIPHIGFDGRQSLGKLVSEYVGARQLLDTENDTSHLLTLPGLLQVSGSSLRSRAEEWKGYANTKVQRLADIAGSIEQVVLGLYGLAALAWPELRIEEDPNQFGEQGEAGDDDSVDPPTNGDLGRNVNDLMSYNIGAIFGRWDLRLVTGQRPVPELPDPFAPLPACSPGMLTGPTGLPARPDEVPPDYPIPIQWDGIIPDDPGHPQDLMAQVRRVFGVLFPDRDPREVEAEACELLGVRDLRSWFANQFFPYHIKRYSKSRRKAPIYWQLRSARKNYSIWLYYHRLTADTLWTVLRNYVDPKLEHEQQVLIDLQARLAAAQAAGQGREERALVKDIQKQEQFLEELTQFRTDILEVANMGYDPDRDDGVLINIAPLRKLVPWPEAAKAWQDLQDGKFPWSTMHRRLGIQGTRGR